MQNPHLSRSVADLRTSLAESRQARARIGLVPTMGAFHEGHLSLMRRARRECDVVVVSLFVNPAQFNEAGDLAAYPRDEQRDLALAAQEGVDFVFAPNAETIYPDGFATTVAVGGVTESLEGAHRGRAHFDGVTTVVAKLLNIVGPDVVYFGQKDAQQAVVIRRMVADLDIPGADRSLSDRSRARRAGAVQPQRQAEPRRARPRGRTSPLACPGPGSWLATASARPARSSPPPARSWTTRASTPITSSSSTPTTLAPVARLNGRPALAVVAARVGDTRLIDNEPIGGD